MRWTRRGESGGSRRAAVAAPLALLVAGLLLPATVRAAELDGSLQISTGTTDVDGDQTDVVDQQANLLVRQVLTDYLTVRVGYRYFDFSSETADGDFGRRSAEPRVELIYARPNLFGSFAYQDRTSTDLATSDDLEVESMVGQLTWHPIRSATLSARYRDESNVLDTGVFGRGTDSRLLDLTATYQRAFWTASYTFETWDASNRESGLEIDQVRHEARLDAGRGFLDDRLWLGFDAWADRVDQQRSAGGILAEPVPARVGLGGVDTSPEVGELPAVAGLVDGDTTTPVEPRLDVGGAATFRNVGVDLGLTRPVTRLEVSVDAASDPGLPWRVYRSRDNLLWEEVAGVTSTWDGGELRYTLRFPEIEDRYFKAVNVGINGVAVVAVTEVRALREAGSGTLSDGVATLYRADLTARFQPTRRVSANVGVGLSQDENLAGSVAHRDFEDVHAQAQVNVILPADLRLTSAYRYLDFEDRVEPVLQRTEEVLTHTLVWTPLDTFEATLTHVQRDESDGDVLVRSTATTRLSLLTELLPELELRSTVEQSDVEDPFFGTDRTLFAWRENVDARVTRTLTLGGGYSHLEYEAADGAKLLERDELDLRATWRARPFLTLSADLGASDDRSRGAVSRDSLRQSYALTYTPGTRITLSGAYQEFSDEALRETRSTSAAANYRLNPRFRLFGNYTRSESRLESGTSTRINSFRAGFALLF